MHMEYEQFTYGHMNKNLVTLCFTEHGSMGKREFNFE